MNEDQYIEVNCSFRAILKSDKIVDEFKLLYTGQDVTVGKFHSDNSKPVIVLELYEGINIDSLECFIKKHNCEIISHNFFISVNTSYDSYIIDIPEYVVKLIQRIGGEVSFSYTFMDIDED